MLVIVKAKRVDFATDRAHWFASGQLAGFLLLMSK